MGVGREKEKWWGLGVFSPDPPEYFLPKIGRKLRGKHSQYGID